MDGSLNLQNQLPQYDCRRLYTYPMPQDFNSSARLGLSPGCHNVEGQRISGKDWFLGDNTQDVTVWSAISSADVPLSKHWERLVHFGSSSWRPNAPRSRSCFKRTSPEPHRQKIPLAVQLSPIELEGQAIPSALHRLKPSPRLALPWWVCVSLRMACEWLAMTEDLQATGRRLSNLGRAWL